MKLIHQTTNLAEQLASTLTDALKTNRRVIWLVPGGSNIPISIAAMDLLDDALTENLIIMQTDERYVDRNSDDCNWHTLKVGGFSLKRAAGYPVLLPEAQSRDMTVAAYQETVRREFATADCIIGQFGIGADGHIAGIKPKSPASIDRSLVSGYTAEDFERITLTFPALRQVTIAKTFAFGDSKHPTLEKLTGDSPPLEEFPAGILKVIGQSVIYTD